MNLKRTISSIITVLGTSLILQSTTFADDLSSKMVLDTVDYQVFQAGEGGIAYNGQFYLYAQGNNSIVYKSTDGIHWSKVQPIPGDTAKALIWDGNQFMLVQPNHFLTSKDGVSWVSHIVPAPNGMNYVMSDVIHANNKYIFTGYNYDPNNSNQMDFNGGKIDLSRKTVRIVVSADLQSFTDAQTSGMVVDYFGSERLMDSLTWGGNVYLANGTASAASSDAMNWIGHEGHGGVGKIIWDGLQFWGAMWNNISSSTDGINWEVRYSFTPATWHQDTHSFDNDGIPVYLDAIGYNGGEYVAAGFREDQTGTHDFTFFHSNDGTHWQEQTIPNADTDVTKIQPTKDGFLLAGNKIWNISSLPSSWAVQPIEQAKSNQLVSETVLSHYQVDITRAEFSELAVRLYTALTGKKPDFSSPNPFTDTSDPYVLQAYQLGIIHGEGEGKFAPDDLICREDLAVMLSRALTVSGRITSDGTPDWTSSFSDADRVSDYAVPALQLMTNKKIITGKENNLLDPSGNATREEAIVMLERTFDAFKTN